MEAEDLRVLIVQPDLAWEDIDYNLNHIEKLIEGADKTSNYGYKKRIKKGFESNIFRPSA